MSDTKNQLELLRGAVPTFEEVLEVLNNEPLDPVVEQYIRDHVSPIEVIKALRDLLKMLDKTWGDLRPIGLDLSTGEQRVIQRDFPGPREESNPEFTNVTRTEEVTVEEAPPDPPDPIHPLGPEAECIRKSWYFWKGKFVIKIQGWNTDLVGTGSGHAAVYHRKNRWWELWREGPVEAFSGGEWVYHTAAENQGEIAVVYVRCSVDVQSGGSDFS